MEKELLLFLKTTNPFYLLSNEALKELMNGLKKKEYEADTLIFRQEVSRVEHLSIIFKGRVEKYFINENTRQQEFLEVLGEGQTFGEISILLNNTRSIRTVMAVEHCVTYELPEDKFILLCKLYEDFFNYFAGRFGRRMLDNNYAGYLNKKSKSRENYQGSEDYFSKSISSVYARKITSCYLDMPIKEVAATMTKQRSGCVLIKDHSHNYQGFITDIDLRNKVVATGFNVNAPVSAIMSSPIITIDAEAFIYEAILLMFKKKISYLVVLENGNARGIISRNKLLASQAKSPFMFIQAVRLANSVEELSSQWAKVPFMVNQLLSRGVKAEIVNQIITTVSDAIAHNIIYSTIKEMGEPPAKFTFMMLGSEGRKEQTLRTDQDNAIIYEDVMAEKREEVRNYFLGLAGTVSDKLNQVGFVHCTGGFMAKNPKWCHSLSHWKNNYKKWISEADAESAMKTIIFFDCRSIFGDPELLESLRNYVFKLLEKSSSRFTYQLALKVLETKPPLSSFFRSFQLISMEDRKNVLDIKKAMRTVVDFSRIYALNNNIRVTNTGERLACLMEAGILRSEEYQELIQAYYYMMELRLKNQALAIIRDNVKPDNLIDPKSITKIERVTLKEVFKVVEKYQLKLSIDYTGSLST